MAIVLGAVVFCFGPRLLLGADDKAPNLEIGVWRLPPGFLTSADPSNKDGIRKPRDGVQPKNFPYREQYDASEYLKKLGILFPPGSKATFDQDSGTLVMLNTSDALDMADASFSGCRIGLSSNVVVEISTLECAPVAEKKLFESGWPTFFLLSSLPPDEIKLLDRVAVVTNSGRRTTMRHISGLPARNSEGDKKKDSEDEDRFREGESGSIVEVEPTIGPDEISVDTSVEYRFREAGDAASETSFVTTVLGWENYPVVIYAANSRKHEGSYLVVTAKVSLVNQGGWKLPQPQAPPSGQAQSKDDKPGKD